MGTNMPTGLDTFVNPLATDTENGVPHHSQHSNANDSIAALEKITVGPIYYNAKGYGSDIMAAYNAAEAAGGGTVFLIGPFSFSSNLVFDSPLVSVVGVGSASVILTAVGTASIIIKTSPFTIAQGPRFYGFTVRGDASNPAGAVGVQFGDITGAEVDDIVVESYTGAGSIGVLVDTAVQTELNVFGRVRISNCKTLIKFTNSNPAFNSLARFKFGQLHLDVQAGQIGFQMRNNTNIYGGYMRIVGNMTGAGTFFDIGDGTTDTCGINGGHWEIVCEQTSGSGGIPYKVGANAYAYLESGYCRFEGSLAAGVVAGAPRHTPGWRTGGFNALIVGRDDPIEGQFSNFQGSGNTATMHPLLWDSMQDPYATIGFLTGPNIRCPYVTMFDSESGGFIIYKYGSGGPNNVNEVARITNQGHIIVSGGAFPTAANQAALGSGAPAAQTSGNNTKGTVSLGTGTGTTTGHLARVTYGNAWPVIPEVVLQPLTPACWDLKYTVVRTTTYFDIYCAVAPLVSQVVGVYAWSYHALG